MFDITEGRSIRKEWKEWNFEQSGISHCLDVKILDFRFLRCVMKKFSVSGFISFKYISDINVLIIIGRTSINLRLRNLITSTLKADSFATITLTPTGSFKTITSNCRGCYV